MATMCSSRTWIQQRNTISRKLDLKRKFRRSSVVPPATLQMRRCSATPQGRLYRTFGYTASPLSCYQSVLHARDRSIFYRFEIVLGTSCSCCILPAAFETSRPRARSRDGRFHVHSALFVDVHYPTSCHQFDCDHTGPNTCAEVVSWIPGVNLTPVVKSVAKCRAGQVLNSSRKHVYCRQDCHEIRTCVTLDPKDEGRRRHSCCENYARRNRTPSRRD